MIERWNRVGRGTRVLLLMIVGVVAINVVLRVLDTTVGGGAPGGPTSSSYATGDDGLAAWAMLLDERGIDVTRLREPLDRVELPDGATVVVADPERFSEEEERALAAFVLRGGAVIMSGESAEPIVRALGPELTWSSGGGTDATVLEGGTGAARVLRMAGGGWWTSTGGATVVARVGDEPVVVRSGSIVALADTGPLTNALLDEADNAAFAIGIVGDGPVLFTEAAHGYGRDGFSLGDLPDGWDTLVIGLVLAGVAWVWSMARRFGPPNAEEELPPPPRRAYVDALAASTVRTAASEEAIAPLRAHARRRLAHRAGVDASINDDELRRAAANAGVDATVVDGVLVGGIMELGRAAARLEET